MLENNRPVAKSPEYGTVRGRGTNDAIKGCGANSKPEILQNLLEQFNYDFFAPPVLLPYKKHLAILEFLRSNMYTALAVEAGYELLGYQQWKMHLEGPSGRLVALTARMIGPERATKFFVNGMAIGLSFGTHIIEEVRKGYARYHQYNILDHPAFTCGNIKAALEISGAKEIKIVAKKLAPGEQVFEAYWQ